jgi:hypothetical protein
MQTMQGSTLQSLVAVQTFLDANADSLGTVVTSGARKKLDDLVLQLSGHAAVQTGSAFAAQGATQKHKLLRQALLRDHMAPIARIAAAELPATPEVEPLKMPRGDPSVARLSAIVAGMAKAAAPFTDVFVGAGLPADFIAQLTAASDAVVKSVRDRLQTKGVRRGATNGLKTMLSDGRKIVHVLDAFVKTALKDDPTRLANWNVVKRVQRVGRSGATPTPSPTPAPTPAPTAAAVPTPSAAA